MTKFIFILFSFVLFSCASNDSQRIVNKSDVTFTGGKFEKDSWDDRLIFKKYSWFKGASISNELLVASMKAGSPFTKWLGSEGKIFNKCSELKIVIAYSAMNNGVGNSYMFSQIEKSGYERILLTDFSQYLMAHPNYADWKLSFHKIVGFCRVNLSSQHTEITLPGFTTQVLNI